MPLRVMLTTRLLVVVAVIVVQTSVEGVDWNAQNKIDPDLSHIKQGAKQAIAIVLGQSLKPDGTASQLLIDRAIMAKTLLDKGAVTKIVVSGGDPAGVGHTEASMMANVLVKQGVSKSAIILESQALTTAENAWFLLRWIPNGTGAVYLVTSEFHMARAKYTFQAVFNHYYAMVQDKYARASPRLTIIPQMTESYCGLNASRNRDDDPHADISTKSLAKRASDELRFLDTGEVARGLFGPRNADENLMYIWPIQIDVGKDPDNERNFDEAWKQAAAVKERLTKCKEPPEPSAERNFH
eukprot:TRINITY_DN8605_c0_g1_i1.p1 TRINITY_DN8605_c0_g1~~TRINITY_DN8605_c0_g1_i1.p1  ORF type:complete len:297 (+),score=48.10 TRINITY_DN8605_c0_g1_i1:58-948(+)